MEPKCKNCRFWSDWLTKEDEKDTFVLGRCKRIHQDVFTIQKDGAYIHSIETDGVLIVAENFHCALWLGNDAFNERSVLTCTVKVFYDSWTDSYKHTLVEAEDASEEFDTGDPVLDLNNALLYADQHYGETWLSSTVFDFIDARGGIQIDNGVFIYTEIEQ